MKTKSLIQFLKDECANYDKHYGECLSAGDECLVLAGKRCDYFEKVVLGPVDYKYRLPGYDYSKLYAQYAEQTGAETKMVKQRRCECGEPLLNRHRYCKKCREQKRRESYRNHRKSKSLVRHS